jgi:hypothetical protein
MLATVTEVLGAVVRGATYCLGRSFVLCQDLVGSQDARREPKCAMGQWSVFQSFKDEGVSLS